jgi:hypothetical protein
MEGDLAVRKAKKARGLVFGAVAGEFPRYRVPHYMAIPTYNICLSPNSWAPIQCI